MILNELRTIVAITHGIQTDKLSKIELMHFVQTAEGNIGCFGTISEGKCDQIHCCWRKHCFESTNQQIV